MGGAAAGGGDLTPSLFKSEGNGMARGSFPKLHSSRTSRGVNDMVKMCESEDVEIGNPVSAKLAAFSLF